MWIPIDPPHVTACAPLDSQLQLLLPCCILDPKSEMNTLGLTFAIAIADTIIFMVIVIDTLTVAVTVIITVSATSIAIVLGSCHCYRPFGSTLTIPIH